MVTTIEGPARAGTARIVGQVVDAASGSAVARARVNLISARIGITAEITTSETGQFAFENLAAGEYRVWIAKAGFLTGGAAGRNVTMRSQDGNQIRLSPGETRVLRVELLPASLLLGRVLAPDGEPVEGARATLLPVSNRRARAHPLEQGIVTNDAGEFRIPRVAAGSYLLLATGSQGYRRWQEAGSLVPTYYPGVKSAAEAVAIDVAQGVTLSGLDIVLQDVKSGIVTGSVLDAAGRPPSGGMVQVSVDREGVRVPIALPDVGGDIQQDGSFRLRLPEGEYWLTVTDDGGGGIGSISLDGAAASSPEAMLAAYAEIQREMRERGRWGSARVTVGREGVNGLTIRLEPLVPVTGRFVFEERRPDTEAVVPAEFRLAAAGGHECHAAPTTAMPPDWSFELAAIPGRCLPFASAGRDWSVKAILHEGVNIAGRTVTLEPGHSMENVLVVLTHRRNQLALTVLDAKGAATNEYVAVVFPVDESQWGMTESVKFHVPAAGGTAASARDAFVEAVGPHVDRSRPIGGLVPGDYYAIAIDDAAWEDVVDPSSLRRLAQIAAKFHIREGETRHLELRRTRFAEP